jgi:uncharacterized membrane protein YtjA (UPF0391 family)
MLRWALTFLIVALIAGILGFGALEGLAMWFAKVLFVVFLILFLVSLVAGRRKSKSPIRKQVDDEVAREPQHDLACSLAYSLRRLDRSVPQVQLCVQR